jgi:FixJ family two-component response regulator
VNPLKLLSSGAACIEFMQKNYQPLEGAHPQRCLIFLDLSMAPMNGIETLKALNGLVLAPDPWIVMLSAMTDVRMIREGYQLGARTFLNKPLGTRELNDFITNEKALTTQMTAEGYKLVWER